MITQAHREHKWHMGHKVTGHEGQCAHFHGHEYTITFYCEASLGQLDSVGRVIDFSVIKEKLCSWIDENWDHKFMISSSDSVALALQELDPEGVVIVAFNPTAENIASQLLGLSYTLLSGTGVKVTKIILYETSKCGVTLDANNASYPNISWAGSGAVAAVIPPLTVAVPGVAVVPYTVAPETSSVTDTNTGTDTNNKNEPPHNQD